MKRLRKPVCQHGLAVVEFAMILPILMVLMFGVVDFGRAVLVKQVMINLSREAANLASRGTSMPDVITAIHISAAPLDLQTNGYVVVTEVQRDTNGNLTISKQAGDGGRPANSHIGSGQGSPATLPATNMAIPLPGQNMYVAEIFYHSPPITPLGQLVNITLSESFYDSAFF